MNLVTPLLKQLKNFAFSSPLKVFAAFSLFVLSLSNLHAEGYAEELLAYFPESPRFPVFEQGDVVTLEFVMCREKEGKEESILWSVRDYEGNVAREGELPIIANRRFSKEQVLLKDLPAGYWEVHAHLKEAGVSLPRRGSRPEGIASFGIVTGEVKALPLAHPDESRFGIHGTNFIESGILLKGHPYSPLYKTLGAGWVNALEDWATAERDRPGQYREFLRNPWRKESDYIYEEHLAPLNCVAYMPWWAIQFPENVTIGEDRMYKAARKAQAYPPKDPSQYADYLRLLSAHLLEKQEEMEPSTTAVYYQIGWEPDWNWKGTDEEFVSLYGTIYDAIHEGDPDAVVLGPGYGVLAEGVEQLETLLPMGLADSLDGIATHGYYVPFGNPDSPSLAGRYVSPEDGGIIESIRRLRELMAEYFEPDAKLLQTEWGLDYRAPFSAVSPELLRLQAAYVIRGHLLFLGEGCDATFFFRTSDRMSPNSYEAGYGLCFNLTMPLPNWGATDLSPKPVFMAASTLTRVLEGTKTIGPVDLGVEGVMAYAFDRDGQTVLAVWCPDDQDRKVRLPVDEDARWISFMGNKQTLPIENGGAEVTSSMCPSYLLGVDLSRLKTGGQSLSH